MSDPGALIERGIRESDSLQHLKARDTFKQAIELYEAKGDEAGKLDAVSRLAKAHYDEGNEKEALELWESIVEGGGKSDEVYAFLLGHYAHGGQHEEASRIWKSWGGAGASDSDTLLAAASFLATGSGDEAATLYRSLIDDGRTRGQRPSWVWERWSRAYIKLDKPIEAVEVLFTGLKEIGHASNYSGSAPLLYRAAQAVVKGMGIERPHACLEGALATMTSDSVEAAVQKIAQARPPEPPPVEKKSTKPAAAARSAAPAEKAAPADQTAPADKPDAPPAAPEPPAST